MEPAATKSNVNERAGGAYLDVLTAPARQDIEVLVFRAFAPEPPLEEFRLEKREGVTRTVIRWNLADSKKTRVQPGLYVISATSDRRVARGLVRVDRRP